MTYKKILAALLATAACSSAVAMETDRFRTIVADTVSQLEAGDVDADALIALQVELVQIGVAGALEHASEAPEDAKILNYVADNAEKMMAMDLDGIEVAWHDGEAFQEIGTDIEDYDHFSPVVGHVDAVVHPATAVIALRSYKETGDKVFLLQVKDELAEVVEHLAHID
ncbi:hypothetical protein [Aliiruegeria sabulilitoris]|uniref:hypothetical protein n=1 Tax=Aliiruegeria sabulilitoris TaxID=1510458 RepID=UPI00082AD27F|nr:hypothetical protein [Aliiruegeria sabulilitoris]NDR57813.1 hypothetical protein [Pseudoruegeria sp. M32A2M]